jgi:hypothetical protein
MSKEKSIATVIKKLPDRRRFRFFLLFVLISFTFWVTTKLSKEYKVAQAFSVVLKDIPPGIIVDTVSEPIFLTLEASGIEILWYRLFKNQLELTLDDIKFSNTSIDLALNDQYISIQQQLLGSSKLIQISPSIYSIQYSRLGSKRIPILPHTEISLRPGYLGKEDLKVIPDSILVHGSQDILDTLSAIPTFLFRSSDVYQSVNEEINLMPLKGLQYELEQVRLDWTLLRYSEKQLEIHIEIQNLPQGVKVKLFPPMAKIRATLPLANLNATQASDFSIIVDYNEILGGQTESLELKMLRTAPSVKKVIWEPKRVNYLIRK